MQKSFIILLGSLIFSALQGQARIISLLERGLAKIDDGVQRYKTLLEYHKEAIRSNSIISYDGLDKIDLVIPENATSIPLPNNIDFANVKIRVKNCSKDFFLFSLKNEAKNENIPTKALAEYAFQNINSLKHGVKLLIIEDSIPWVERRFGYEYGAIRKDILLLKEGKSQNTTIAPYTANSKIKCFIVEVTDRRKIIKNLTIERTDDSTFKTFLIKIENENNVVLHNITINTPPSQLYGDAAISVSNSTNVEMDSIRINGTYSDKRKWGYGFQMNNVWNSSFTNIIAHARWGVFGDNNMNRVSIKDSDINRFDIHCYGRDVSCTNTTFSVYYNQFSSLFGYLKFDNCIFKEFVPILLEPSYYAYTPFNIIIKDCIFYVNYNRPYIIDINLLNPAKFNLRKELSKPNLPNVYIDGLTIISPHSKRVYLFGFRGENSPKFEFSPIIKIHKVKIISEQKTKLYITNKNNNIYNQKNIFIDNNQYVIY